MAVLLHAKRELLTLEAPPVAGLYAGVVLSVGVTCVALTRRHPPRRSPACVRQRGMAAALLRPTRCVDNRRGATADAGAKV
jgi:hypothetical protein